MKITKITTKYFETEDGKRVYHEVPLEVIPTLRRKFQENFQ